MESSHARRKRQIVEAQRQALIRRNAERAAQAAQRRSMAARALAVKRRKPGTAGKPGKASKPSKASKPAKRSGRSALVSAINKLLAKRKSSLESRVAFARAVRKYLVGTENCVRKEDGQLGLYDGEGNLKVRFAKRIGSESAFGMAYLNTGKGIWRRSGGKKRAARFITFSSKVMAKSDAHAQEIGLLKKMSALAEKGLSPNMPLLYKATEACEVPCDSCDSEAMRLFRSPYYVVVNELADGDLIHWFTTAHTEAEYESVIMQVLLAVRAFHGLGYAHNDCHLGNFLYHKVPPGGYWRYNIHIPGEPRPTSLFVPNRGTLVVLWDPGLATPLRADNSGGNDDYIRPLELIAGVHKYYKPPRHPATHALPAHLFDSLSATVDMLKAWADDPSDTVLQLVTNSILEGESFRNILVGQRLRAAKRRVSRRGSKVVLTKVRERGRTVQESRTVAPRSLMGKIVPVRGYNLVQKPKARKLPRGITVRKHARTRSREE